ncbi:WXG100 family type VII secretion target [Kitasatospora sp. NPDC094011]|uniref:WXG100 family type VII secretion target n=1 Tax=Kitasatospora sp. NPDC094011 TaxID=3364090 RepID=UPI00382D7213
MAGNNMLNDPAVVQQVLTTVEAQDQHMQETQRQINAITEEITAHFQAAASTVFVEKMQDWQAKYDQVRQQYKTFHDLLTSGSGLIQGSGQDAVQVVSGLGVGDDIVKGLS